MAGYLGIEAVDEKPYIFISYNTKDQDRVGRIVKALQKYQINIWYDKGIKRISDEEWQEQIALHIRNCEIAFFFITSGIFNKDNSWVRREYNIAKRRGRKICIVLLDKIDDDAVPAKYDFWWEELRSRQCLEAVNLTDQDVAEEMYSECMNTDAFQADDGKVQESRKGIINNISNKEIPKPKKSLISIVNNTCFFGSYPQDADGTVRPIQWRVLEVDQENGKALLLSEKILDSRPYYAEQIYTNWEKAGLDNKGLRYWLNHEFYEKAFVTEEEKKAILTTTVEPHLNPYPEYREDQGKAVQDKIFLLSAEEVIQYFPKSEPDIGDIFSYSDPGEMDDVEEIFAYLDGYQVSAEGTEYAKKNTEIHVDEDNENSFWWLRSVGSLDYVAGYIDLNGSVVLYGAFVDLDGIGVRPALWIDLKA